MAAGDALIHRAVGSAGSRLVAVGVVITRAHLSGHERWPWQVGRRLVHVRTGLEAAPTIADIGETASGPARHEGDTRRERLLAERLIAGAASS